MTGHKWKKVKDLTGHPSVRYAEWVCTKCDGRAYTSPVLEKLKPSKHEVVKHRDNSPGLTCEERIAQQVIEE
jgi:hypothetical protein